MPQRSNGRFDVRSVSTLWFSATTWNPDERIRGPIRTENLFRTFSMFKSKHVQRTLHRLQHPNPQPSARCTDQQSASPNKKRRIPLVPFVLEITRIAMAARWQSLLTGVLIVVVMFIQCSLLVSATGDEKASVCSMEGVRWEQNRAEEELALETN